MNKEALKSSFKITSNVLLFLSLILQVLSVGIEEYEFYFSVAAIATCVIGILVTLLRGEGIKILTKDLNLYCFVVVIVLSIATIIGNRTLFFIGVVLFILMILLYLIPLFVTEKEDKTSKGKKKK